MPTLRHPVPGRRPEPGSGSGAVSFSTVPQVLSASPTSARTNGGTSVTLTGFDFVNQGDGTPPTVMFGDEAGTNVVVVDRNTITVDTPATDQLGIVDVIVTTPGGSGVLYQIFQFYTATISAIVPGYGIIAGGEEVQVVGFNFVDGASIFFGGIAATNVTFVDSERYLVTTPPHEKGWVDVDIVDPGPAGASATLRNGFQFVLLTRGDDIRRQPGITIRDVLNNQPNSCTFTVDGDSNVPIVGEEIEITDSQDGDRRLFAGTVQTIEQIYEGQTNQLAFVTTCVDFTFLANKYRPFGRFVNTSVTGIVKSLFAKYAPDFTTEHVQTNLTKVSVEYDGTRDMSTCLNELAAAIGGGHWYIDYDRDVHFFHIVPQSLLVPSLPQVPTLPGDVDAMVVTQGDEIPSSFSYAPGWYRFATTARYVNDIQSKLSPWSNWVYLDGHHQIEFSNIPIYTPPAGMSGIAGRRIYNNTMGPLYLPTANSVYGGGVNKTASMKSLKRFGEIPDNVTTSFSIWYGQGWDLRDDSGQPVGSSLSTFVNIPGSNPLPKMPSTSHPPSPTSAPGGEVVTFSGPSTRGQYFFQTSVRVAFYYEDGSVSYVGPPSSAIQYSATYPNFGTLVRGVSVTNIPVGPEVDGVPCIARFLYCTIGNSTNWGGTVNGLFIVPDNTSTTAFINPPGQLDVPYPGDQQYGPHGNYNEETSKPYYPSSAQPPAGVQLEPDPVPVWPNPDGPWLEDDSRPADIDEDNEDLLREPQITQNVDLSQIRNRVYVIGRGSSLTANIAIGDTTIPIADPAAFALGGGRVIIRGEVYLYAGPTGADTSIGEDGAWYLALAESIRVAAESGEAVNNFMQLDDVESQKQLADVELLSDGTKSDGVHEGVIVDGSLKTIFQLFMRGSAELEVFGRPIVTVNYATRDPLTRSGKLVNIDLQDPPISGEFLIQDVTIDQIHDESDQLMPRYNVRASSVKFDLNDLLLQMVGGSKDLGGSVGVAASAIATAAASAPAAGVQLLTVQVTSAQFATLNSAPLVILAAPEAKFAIVPVAYTASFNVTNDFANSPTFGLRFTGAATGFEWFTTTWGPTQPAGIRTRATTISFSNLFENGIAGRWPVAKSLEIFMSLNPSGGVATLEFTLAYYVSQFET